MGEGSKIVWKSQNSKKLHEKFMLAFNIPGKYLKKKECILSLIKSYDYILFLKSYIYLTKKRVWLKYWKIHWKFFTETGKNKTLKTYKICVFIEYFNFAECVLIKYITQFFMNHTGTFLWKNILAIDLILLFKISRNVYTSGNSR